MFLVTYFGSSWILHQVKPAPLLGFQGAWGMALVKERGLLVYSKFASTYSELLVFNWKAVLPAIANPWCL